MTKRIVKGDKVLHLTHGAGLVLDEWGSWSSCRNCFREMPLGKYRTDKRGKIKYEHVVCPHCSQTTFPLRVNGAGIFDVRFEDDKIRSVNKTWLNK